MKPQPGEDGQSCFVFAHGFSKFQALYERPNNKGLDFPCLGGDLPAENAVLIQKDVGGGRKALV